MIPSEDDLLAAALRHALHDSADSFEPTGDGLENIRRELRAPGHQRAERRLRSAGLRLGWLLRVWAEPLAGWAESVAAWARARSGPDRPWIRASGAAWTWGVRAWSATLVAARAQLSAQARSGRRAPAHAMPPTPSSRRATRLLWLRWGAAVTGAAVIAGLGMYGLAQLRQTVITQFAGDSSTAVSPPASHSPAPRSATPSPSAVPTVLAPPPSVSRRTHRHAKPRPTCLPTPSGSPTGSQSPSPAQSPSATPSPGSSTTPGPSPSPGATTGVARTASALTSTPTCSPAP